MADPSLANEQNQISVTRSPVFNWLMALFLLQSGALFLGGFAVWGTLLFIGKSSAGDYGFPYEFIKLVPSVLILPAVFFILSLVYLWTGFIVRHGSKKTWQIALSVLLLSTLVFVLVGVFLFFQMRYLYMASGS